MKTAFYTWITANFKNTNTDFDSFYKSFKYFHPEIDLIVFEQPTIDKLFNEKPWLNSTNCKASFAKLICDDYDLLVGVDSDFYFFGSDTFDVKVPPPRFKTDNNITLTGSFRVWHDAASQNEIPDPTRVADAPIVAAGIVAETVGRNYGAFYKNKEQLDALQQWVKDQSIIK